MSNALHEWEKLKQFISTPFSSALNLPLRVLLNEESPHLTEEKVDQIRQTDTN